MPVVLLVRHGQASFGADDYDVLSDLGREQSRVVGEELRRRALRDPLLVTGSLRRQRDTAALALPGVQARVDERWDEYDHLELLKRYVRAPDPTSTASDPPTSSREVQGLLDAALLAWVEHGGSPDRPDSWPAFASGASDALRELVEQLGRGRDAVVVTSGGVIAAVCTALVSGGAETVVALNRTAVNGAITKLVAGSRGVSLSSYNEHAHLPPDQVTYR
ncbi:MAG: histidine phosphatase family protein [Actinomycetes bacterium]